MIMKLFNKILGKKSKADILDNDNLTEYDAWLNSYQKHHLDFDTWKYMALSKYAEDPLDKYIQYEQEMRPIWDAYYNGLQEIEAEWSQIYNSKKYVGATADKYEDKCLKNISLYKIMSKKEMEYGGTPPQNVPGYKRLAMLYERQGLYEKSIIVCVDALKSGADNDDMRRRLRRMIKKAGRSPTANERTLIDE